MCYPQVHELSAWLLTFYRRVKGQRKLFKLFNQHNKPGANIKNHTCLSKKGKNLFEKKRKDNKLRRFLTYAYKLSITNSRQHRYDRGNKTKQAKSKGKLPKPH